MNASHSISRRHLLRVGVGSCMSLSLGRYLELQAAEGPAASVARANSVIHIFLPGALGQHESWDPKPEAAAEYRGEFGAIGTKVPGMQLCELLKKTAGVADNLTLLRGVWHTESAHERGQMTMLTGWRPSPAVCCQPFTSTSFSKTTPVTTNVRNLSTACLHDLSSPISGP